MTVILVFAMFVTLFVVESFTHKPASEYGLQTAESIVVATQPIVAEHEVPEQPRLLHIRTRSDRRQAERRGRGGESVA